MDNGFNKHAYVFIGAGGKYCFKNAITKGGVIITYLYDVIWDAGHGGKDPGAVAAGKQEKDFTLAISLYQHRRARDLGLRSALVRSSDETLSLEDHAARVTSSGSRIGISNHINSGGGTGAEVYHSLRQNPALAGYIMDALDKAGAGRHGSGVKTRGSSKRPGKDYYRMHYTGGTETVIVEYAFIDNPVSLIAYEANWKKYAEAVLYAVCKYLGKPYNKPEKGEPKMVNWEDAVIKRLLNEEIINTPHEPGVHVTWAELAAVAGKILDRIKSLEKRGEKGVAGSA